MADVISLDARRVRQLATVVSITWALDQATILVYVINSNDRTQDREIGAFPDHASAAKAALEVARTERLYLVDHTALTGDASGVWDLRPVPSHIVVSRDSYGSGFSVSVSPDSYTWSALGGCCPTLDVAGDRAVDLSEKLGLRIVDKVLGAVAPSTILGGDPDPSAT